MSPCSTTPSAGPVLVTSTTSAPLVLGRPRLCGHVAVTSWMPTPSQPRRVSPNSASCSTTGRARLTGTAKPMPSDEPPRAMIAVLMPTTLPSMSNSGPPELPWLIAASVWMKSSYGPVTGCRGCAPKRSPASPSRRARTDCRSPSPSRRLRALSLSPNSTNGSGWPASTLQHREVGLVVGADQFGGQPRAVGQEHLDVVGALDDVVVGDDQPVGADDEARAEAARLLPRPPAPAPGWG